MIDLKNTEVKEIAKYLSCEVNYFSFEPEKLATEQKDSADMKDLDIYWIKILFDKGYMTDLRNEQAAIADRLLTTIPFNKKRLESVDNRKTFTIFCLLTTKRRLLN